MTSSPKPRPVTAEEFAQFNPEWRYDLIEGELRPMPPMPGAKHGVITLDISIEIGSFVREHRSGRCFAAETRFTIERNPDTAIGPDFAFVAKERLPSKMPDGFLELAPDLVLEVRSPSDRSKEVKEKAARWLKAGVKIVWELDPKRRLLTVHRSDRLPQELGVEDVLTGEEVLPGFTLPLRRLFTAEENERGPA